MNMKRIKVSKCCDSSHRRSLCNSWKPRDHFVARRCFLVRGAPPDGLDASRNRARGGLLSGKAALVSRHRSTARNGRRTLSARCRSARLLADAAGLPTEASGSSEQLATQQAGLSRKATDCLVLCFRLLTAHLPSMLDTLFAYTGYRESVHRESHYSDRIPA